MENIARNCSASERGWLPALREKGFTVLHADAPAANASGILSFYRPGRGHGRAAPKADGARIQVSLRADREGQNYLRVSPHFYNTDAELHRLMESL